MSNHKVRATRTRPSVYALPHYMGDHPLFANAATAKRFPDIDRVSPAEIAHDYRLPPPMDKQRLKLEELKYHEPHNPKPPMLRELGPLHEGAKPFIPSNASAAKRAIQTPTGSIFCDNMREDAEAQQNEREVSKRREAFLRVSDRPFSRGTVSEAQSRIKGLPYLFALDEAQMRAVQQASKQRIRRNRALLMASQYGRASPHRSLPPTR